MPELYKVVSANESKINSSGLQGNVSGPQLELEQRMTGLDIHLYMRWGIGEWSKLQVETRLGSEGLQESFTRSFQMGSEIWFEGGLQMDVFWY